MSLPGSYFNRVQFSLEKGSPRNSLPERAKTGTPGSALSFSSLETQTHQNQSLRPGFLRKWKLGSSHWWPHPFHTLSMPVPHPLQGHTYFLLLCTISPSYGLCVCTHTFCPVTSSCRRTCICTPHPCRHMLHMQSRARRAGLGKVVNLIHGVCVCVQGSES